jgi:hypothetical protein
MSHCADQQADLSCRLAGRRSGALLRLSTAWVIRKGPWQAAAIYNCRYSLRINSCAGCSGAS